MPEPIMQFFSYAHLPENLRAVSKPFCELAMHIEATIPRNAERSVALRKLLESKDASVRAFIAVPAPQPQSTENTHVVASASCGCEPPRAYCLEHYPKGPQPIIEACGPAYVLTAEQAAHLGIKPAS